MPPDTLIQVQKYADGKQTTGPIIAGSVSDEAASFAVFDAVHTFGL